MGLSDTEAEGNSASDDDRESCVFSQKLKRPANSPDKPRHKVQKKKSVHNPSTQSNRQLRSTTQDNTSSTHTSYLGSIITNNTMPNTTTSSPTLPPPADNETSIFFTPNPYAPLSVQEEENIQPETTESHHKTPPIFVHNVNSYLELCKDLSQLIGPNSFSCKSRASDTKINTNSIISYRTTVKYLRDKGADFHTYQIKEEKAYRVVLRHLHPSTPVEAIKDEIELKGFRVRAVTKILHPIHKTPLPLFFLDLEPQANNSDIFKLKNLLYTQIKVEEPHKNLEIVQCKRCQKYGHTRGYCFHAPKCVKCAGDHPSSSCTKPRDIPPTCTLCFEEHSANYRGCIVHKELQRLRRANERERSGQVSAPNATKPPKMSTVNYPNLPRLRQQQQPQQEQQQLMQEHQQQHQGRYTVSYAGVAGAAPSRNTFIPSPPTATDITSLLSTFINEFKSLINPLITLLTSVVTELLPKLCR